MRTHLFRIAFPAVFILLLFVNLPTSAAAQPARLDSMLKVLPALNSDTSRTNTLNAICQEYLQFPDGMQKAIEFNQQLFSLSAKNDYKKGVAQSFLNSGVIFKNKGNIDSAIFFHLKSIKLIHEINWKKGEVIVARSLGIIYAQQANYKKAIEYMSRSVAIAMEIKDKQRVAEGTMNIGNVYLCLGDYTKSLQYYYSALHIQEELNNRKAISIIYNNIGNVLISGNKFTQALIYYKKSMDIQEQLGDKEVLGHLYSNMADIYLAQNNIDSALDYNFRALKTRQAIDSKQGMMISFGNIGSVYLKQKKYKEALSYQFKSLELAEKFGFKRQVAEACNAIGKIYEETGDYTNALTYCDKQLALGKVIDYRELMREAYFTYASVYRKLKQFDKALDYIELYHGIKDTLLNKENLKQIAELNTRYETEQKENEILVLTKDKQLNAKIIRQQQLVRWGLIGGILLLFISVFSIFKRYRYKQKANKILEKQNHEIEKKNLLITDSIDYAKTIQEAVLPGHHVVHAVFPQHFIFYKPKAIVSGDFYWVNTVDNKLICAVADCTGHGVPGAFMSLLGYNMLENSIKKTETDSPAEILHSLNAEVITRLSQHTTERTTKHGMDIALISIDTTTHVLQYAGAHNSLYIARDNKIEELKADKRSIGTGETHRFTNQTFQLRKGDMIYLFTDGFPDQIGGPHRKKFYYSPFRDLLASISMLDMEAQQKKLEGTLVDWLAGKYEQTDDILVMGIKYPF
jgi:serine phosphatase RsbU (regulator of sigma subunit)